jgi:uncharacterized protein (TIGR03067 family)
MRDPRLLRFIIPLFGVFCATVAGLAGGFQPIGNEKELERFQGTWKAVWGVSAEDNFNVDPRFSQWNLTIRKNEAQWTTIYSFMKPGKAKLDLEPMRNPARITLREGKTAMKGIYRFMPSKDKDDRPVLELQIRFAEPGDDYPATFGKDIREITPGSKEITIGFQRTPGR